MTKVLCLTGMHRSGTSLTASWIQKCGMTIDDGLIVGKTLGNYKGHFEDQEFVDLHSDAIKSYSPNSLGWKIYSERYLSFRDEELLKAKNLIASRQKYEMWGWKDPRTTFFLKQWKTLIPEMKTLLIWRPASEVVFSLVKRSIKAKEPVFKINLIEAIRLWVAQNDMVCNYQREYPNDALIVPLKFLIENDKKTIEMINDKFNFSLNYVSISEVYENRLLNDELEQKAKFITQFIPAINRIEKRLMSLSNQ